MKHYHANCQFERKFKGEGNRGKGNTSRQMQVCNIKTQLFLQKKCHNLIPLDMDLFIQYLYYKS